MLFVGVLHECKRSAVVAQLTMTVGRTTLKGATSRGGSPPFLTHGSLGHPSLHLKRYVDRFSRLCTAHGGTSL